MRTDLQLIIGRLAVVRDRMNELISSKGGETQSCNTMYQYANAIATIPDFSHISNGIETFAGNTLLERIPECINSAAFTSMYRFAKGCTALKQVDRLYTSKATTFVYAFHGMHGTETDRRLGHLCCHDSRRGIPQLLFAGENRLSA